MKIDKDLIKQLSESLNEFHLTELEYSDGKTTIKVGKGSKAITTTSPTNESSVKTQAQKKIPLQTLFVVRWLVQLIFLQNLVQNHLCRLEIK